MDFCEINPYVRYVEKISYLDCAYDKSLLSYDHIMLYTTSGTAQMIIADCMYNVERGSIVIIKPGTPYVFIKPKDFEAILIHYDYSKTNSVERGFYIKPVGASDFKPTKEIDVQIEPDSCFNRTLFVKKCNHLEAYFKSILSEFITRDKYFDFRISSSVIIILIDISRTVYAYESYESACGANVINEVIDYIHENFDKNITNEMIAKKFNFHSKYINILMKNKTGYSLHQYILLNRISKSIEYLQNTNLHIYEIAEKVGFSDSCHFTKCFRQIMGDTPKSFRGNKG